MKVLIVKCSSLGDIVQTYPVIDYLRHLNVEIDWVVDERCAELVKAHPHVNQAICFQFKKWNFFHFLDSVRALRKTYYDLIIDLQGNCKSGLMTLLARGKHKIGFSYSSVAEWPNLLSTRTRFTPTAHQNIRCDYLSIVQQFFGDTRIFETSPIRLKAPPPNINLTNKIVIAPASRWPNKCACPATLKEVIKSMSGDYVFLWGNEEEKKNCEDLIESVGGTLLPKLSLSQLQNTLANAKLFIGMDSLPLHLAASAGTPTFSLFGPSSQDKYAPQGAQHHSIQGTCPYDILFEKRCPKLRTCPSGACMKTMKSTILIDKITKITKNYTEVM